jgi:serine/threonine-protein kinase
MTADGDSAAPGSAFVVSFTGFPVPQWDRYEFLALLGRGGMGAVYKARDRRLGRIVALKFIHGDDPGQIQRFMQEARAQSRLAHPHICQVYEVGTVDNKPYIAMQLVDGLSLDKACRTMTLLDKVRVMKEVVEAMHAAHEQGVIHRDLKPSNILVTRTLGSDGTVQCSPMVMDFGLARDSGVGKGMTESGAVMGTPAYMSPEQARGDVRHLDRRTDVYSLGATLYDVIVDKPPFDDETVVKIILKVMNEPAPLLRSQDPTLPEALELIVSKCLNKEADQRYPTALMLAEDLGRFLTSQRVVARRLSYAYRLRYWVSGHRALAAVGGLLACSLLILTGFGIRTYFANLHQERLARQETELAKRLGQDINDLDWRVRIAYSLPLHNAEPDKARVRDRLAQVQGELRLQGTIGERLGHYVLGRGYLALHEFDQAHEHLQQAKSLGVKDLELDYALGRVLGEKYNRAVEDARKSGDKGFFEKRRKELEAEYLTPALAYLHRSQQLSTVPAKYLEALIDFYLRRYDAALLNAHFAQRQDPWLYEALQLQGEVHLARALEYKDSGDHEQAERGFSDAIARYSQAAEVGRSDHRLYEAIAEVWIRQEEMDTLRGRDPRPKMELALAAADRALEAAPRESYGYAKKAFANHFQALYLQRHGDTRSAIALYRSQIESGKLAIVAHPLDAYAYEIVGVGHLELTDIASGVGESIAVNFDNGRKYFDQAIKINPRFPWAYNDYSSLLLKAANDNIVHGKDPSELLSKAIQLARSAIDLDEKYLYAYNTHSAANLILIKFFTESGRDIEKPLREAIGSATQASQINSKYMSPYGNMGLAYFYAARHRLDAGEDGREEAKKSIRSFKELLRINSKVLLAYRDLARAYHLLALHELAVQTDPSDSLEQELAAVQACYHLAPDNSNCQSEDAALQVVQAAWLAKQGRPVAQRLEQAHRLVQQALQKDPDDEELWISLAEICAQQARVASTAPARSLQLNQEGLDAVARVLRIAPGWARALALQGELYELATTLQTEERLKQESRRRARESFEAAFRGNPLLRNHHEKTAARVK